MSMELATTVFEERGKLLKSELNLGSGSEGRRMESEPELGSESRGKRLKSEEEQEHKSDPELEQKLKSKPDGDLVKMDFSEYENSKRPYIYMKGDFVYKNEAWKKSEAEFEDYQNRARGVSPYDAISCPRFSNRLLAPTGNVVPLHINDKKRPTIIHMANLALADYNERSQAPTFEFHQLVKCCIAWSQFSGYYITFEAKVKEDPSNSPAAITTFQALVWEGENKTHEVKECKIKT